MTLRLSCLNAQRFNTFWRHHSLSSDSKVTTKLAKTFLVITQHRATQRCRVSHSNQKTKANNITTLASVRNLRWQNNLTQMLSCLRDSNQDKTVDLNCPTISLRDLWATEGSWCCLLWLHHWIWSLQQLPQSRLRTVAIKISLSQNLSSTPSIWSTWRTTWARSLTSSKSPSSWL